VPEVVMKVPLGGGSPTTLAAGMNAPLGIALDGTSVYWAEQATGPNNVGGRVMKLTPKQR
jgi:hypothetical protein